MEGVAALRSGYGGRAIGGFPLTIWAVAARMLIDQYSTADCGLHARCLRSPCIR